MIFKGIYRKFSLVNESQYDEIGKFWDEMALEYGLENLQGLGYKWEDNMFSYAIGLKEGIIGDFNVSIELPDIGWNICTGRTDNLKQMYDEIYRNGALQYEIEMFYENGDCLIKYYRSNI